MDFRFGGLQSSSIPRWQSILALLKVATRRQTQLNLAYLIVTFPLGLFYFAFRLTGFSVGIGNAIVGIEFVLLVVVLLAAWALRYSSAS